MKSLNPAPTPDATKSKQRNRPATNEAFRGVQELPELHERVLARVRAMTSEEGFQTLVASGIYTPDGKLTKEYGGG